MGDQSIADSQRRCCRNEPVAGVGGRPPPLFQLPGFRRMANQRHAVARHEQRSRSVHRGGASGTAPQLVPAILSARVGARLSTAVGFEPGRRPRRCRRQGFLPAGNPSDAPVLPADGLEHPDGRCEVARLVPGQGPHERETGLKLAGARGLQAVEPGGCCQRLA